MTILLTLLMIASAGITAFAEESASTTTENTDGGTLSPGNSTLTFVIMLAAFGLFAYLFIIRPDKKRRKEAQNLRDSLKLGDTVTSIGGIIGKVTRLNDTTVTLNNGITLKRTAIATIDKASDDIDVEEDDEDEED